MKHLIILCLTLLTCSGCKWKNIQKNEKNKVTSSTYIKYAKGFEINTIGNTRELLIKAPYLNAKEQFKYTIISHKKKASNPSKEGVIHVPVEKIVVTSTTHIPMIELLGEEHSIVGFPHTKYISSPKTRKLIATKSIQEIGLKASLNTEILLDLKPDVVVGFSMGKTNKSLNLIEKSGIPVVLNGDWLEETPLGRAEWIKVFGVLYNKEKLADSIFNVIEKNYIQAKLIASKARYRPRILSGAIMGKDIWNLPAGESFVAQFLTDANTEYIWKDSKGKGSLSISFESALDKGKSADLWIAPGFFKTKEQMLNSNRHYKSFTAFQQNQIYTFTNTIGATGGAIYFELGPTRPDLVLKDIIKITHPELLGDYTNTFFDKMN